MKRALKFTFFLVSLPAVIGMLRAFIAAVSVFDPFAAEHKYLTAGLLTYPVFQVLLSKPLRTYVFGHELTHALASLVMGGKIKKFKFSAKGGSVSVSKTNFLVSLAPYFFPVYTVILIGIYAGAGFFADVSRFRSAYIFCIGFTLSFHLALTVFAVKQRQPDITGTGIFFSLSIILLLSPVCWIIILKVIFHSQVGILRFLRSAAVYAGDIYSRIGFLFMRLIPGSGQG